MDRCGGKHTPQHEAAFASVASTATDEPSVVNTAIENTDAPPVASATITDTPAPVATESRQEAADRIAEEQLVEPIISVEANENTPAVIVMYQMGQNASGYGVAGTEMSMAYLGCALRTSGQFPGWRYLFRAMIATNQSNR